MQIEPGGNVVQPNKTVVSNSGNILLSEVDKQIRQWTLSTNLNNEKGLSDQYKNLKHCLNTNARIVKMHAPKDKCFVT
jgi:hypothetical protein